MENIKGDLPPMSHPVPIEDDDRWCAFCMQPRQNPDWDNYSQYGVSDYEDDKYCTVSTEDIDISDLECDEFLPPWGAQEEQERKDISKARKVLELSKKRKNKNLTFA